MNDSILVKLAVIVAIILMVIGAAVVIVFLATKLGDWLGKNLCNYLDREIKNGKR